MQTKYAEKCKSGMSVHINKQNGLIWVGKKFIFQTVVILEH